MADPVSMVIDAQGNYVSECLHWEGFPLILWEVLSAAGYAHPPQYVGHEFDKDGVTRCRLNFTLVAYPVHPEWPVLAFEVFSHCLEDTWEFAALQALTNFCERNLEIIMFSPIGLFPTAQANDPYRLDKVDHRAFLADGHAPYRLHTLQTKALRQLTDLSRAHYMMFCNKETQFHELGEEIE